MSRLWRSTNGGSNCALELSDCTAEKVCNPGEPRLVKRRLASAVFGSSVSCGCKRVAWAEFSPPEPNFTRGRPSAGVATGRLRSYLAPPAHATQAKPRNSVAENGTRSRFVRSGSVYVGVGQFEHRTLLRGYPAGGLYFIGGNPGREGYREWFGCTLDAHHRRTRFT